MPGLPESMPALLAVCRFHLRVGTRLALAVLVPAFTIAAGVLMFVRPELVRDLAGALFGAGAGLPEALLVLGTAAAAAAVAAPRVGAGLGGLGGPGGPGGPGGWLRHLPVAGATHRRAATAAVALAEAPVLAILALLMAVAWVGQGAAAVAPHLAGLPVVAAAAAQLALPARRRAAARSLALAAGALAGLGSWPALAAALPLAAAADLAAGRPSPRRPWRSRRLPETAGPGRLGRLLAPAVARWPQQSGRRRESRGAPQARPPGEDPEPIGAPPAQPNPERPASGLLPSRSDRRRRGGQAPPWLLPARIAFRALGWRLARCCGVALLPWLAVLLILHDNQLSPFHAARAALLGGGASCALLLASLAQTLALRRPPWPWARSLPWPARRRVLLDAAILGLPCLPLLALAAPLAPAAGAPLAASLPLLAVRAAAAMRRPPEGRRGATGKALIEGLLAAGLVALLPWTAAALLAAVPWAARAAAARERRQKVGLWMERHHLAAGDPQSWSGW
jgi:hypothetical protein